MRFGVRLNASSPTKQCGKIGHYSSTIIDSVTGSGLHVQGSGACEIAKISINNQL